VRAKLTIGFDDQVAVPPREAEALGLAPGDPIDVVAAKGAFLLVAPARQGRSAQAYFAGSLAALTVPEVIQFVFTSLKSGVLLLSFGSEQERAGARGEQPERLRRRSIYFREGQVVFASSSEPSDRLGPVLWRHGLAGWDALERCGRLVRSGRPLGQVLVDEGVLSAGQLYTGVTHQVREILLGACLETEGEFAFLEGPHDESNAVKLQERTRDLLLEGMKRVDEAERLLAALGGRGVVLARAVEPPPGVGEFAARLMRACDGQRTLAEAASESGLGLLEALRQAGPLFAAGALVPGVFAPRPAAEVAAAGRPPGAPALTPAPGSLQAPALTPPPGALHATGPLTTRSFNPFDIYRRCLKKVHASLQERRPGSEQRLNTYFDRLPEKQRPFFEGVRLDEQGDLDVARVLVNVTGTGAWKGAAAKARSLEALEDFLAFALFEVKNVLPKEEADGILREVGRMQVGKA
jgi:hypothetical protein